MDRAPIQPKREKFPLHTSRLRLNPIAADDSGAIASLFADPAVRRYLAIGDLADDAARQFAAEFMRQCADELRETGYAPLAVRRRADDEFVGYCGLRALPDRISAAELVFALARAHWRRGYAREAVTAVLDWGRTIPGLSEVLAMARPDNNRSRAVMQACGMAFAGESSRYYGETLALYRLTLTPPHDPRSA